MPDKRRRAHGQQVEPAAASSSPGGQPGSASDHLEVPGPGRDNWQTLLRSQGYRLTPQRELVLAAVEALGHATPDEVFSEVRRHSDSINLSTIYRTLELLNELGLIRHAHISDRAPTYHSAFQEEHAHLVCRGCRASTSVAAGQVSASLSLITESRGFTPDIGHLVIFGLCGDCK